MIDVFQVTYGADIEWTQYSLRAIKKYLTGHRRVVLCCPQGVPGVEKLAADYGATLVRFKHRDPGHMQQMYMKMTADRWAPGAEFVLYIDSDIMLVDKIDIRKDLFRDGKPLLLSNAWDNTPNSVWRTGSEALLGFSLRYNTMAWCTPVYKTRHLAELGRHLERRHHLSLENLVMTQWNVSEHWFPPRAGGRKWQPTGKPRFSEFCTIGGWCLEKYPNEYSHWHIEPGKPYPAANDHKKAYWSHHEVDPVRAELENIVR